MGKGGSSSGGRFFVALFSVLLFSCSLAGPARAAALCPNPVRQVYNLAGCLDVLSESGKELSIAEVSSSKLSSAFRPLGPDGLYLDGGRPVWVRLTLETPAGAGPGRATWLLQVDNNGVGLVDLYRPLAGARGGWRVSHTGAREPSASREVEHSTFVFRLEPPPGTITTYYLRLEAIGALAVPLKLWSPEAFVRHRQMDFLIYGLIYGSMLSMFLFNFFVYLSLRDPAYLRYVLFIFSLLMCLLMINGHHRVLFDPGPIWAMRLSYIFLGLMGLFAAAFTRSFLSTRTTMPRVDKLVIACMGLGGFIALTGAAGLFAVADGASQLIGVAGPLSAITAGVLRAYGGYRPARYLLLAWSLFLVGSIHLVLQDVGLAPQVVSGLLGMTLGSAVESVLLSFALADRIRLLREEKDALALSRLRYRTASLTDGLTGLYNLRYLQTRLAQEAEEAGRMGHPLSLIMMDVDDFKSFNDAFGHQTGDQVLNRLASILRSSARGSDAACRYGGEEFVLILPATELDQALEVAERIRVQFQDQDYAVGGGPSIKATISAGVAQLRVSEKHSDLLERADRALYLAKSRGKNRVEISPQAGNGQENSAPRTTDRK